MTMITKTYCDFEREPLITPFGFKGGYISEEWQSIALVENQSGLQGVASSVLGILWSDGQVFFSTPEAVGNSIMFMMTAHALRAAEGIEFDTPMDLLDQLLPITYEYGKKITGLADLRLTFALNALVPVDHAAWLLYCREKGITSFDDMLPADIKPALSYRNDTLASIPLITYGIPISGVLEEINNGCFFLKIKIGADPDKDGSQEKMLEWDKKRLSDIHEVIKDREIPYTDNGYIPYYLDANGRYDSKDRLLRLLDHAEKIGALERIMIMEEPFPEEYKVDVHDVPVRLASDESAHSNKDAIERIDLGYGAIALKPIAKTMSMSLKIAKTAWEKGVPCFCADLTVNPVMIDWNKNVAARLAPLPGLKIGLLETNGHQYYANWKAMKGYHPCNGAPWTETVNGMFTLDDDFYARSGGIFEVSDHYRNVVHHDT